MDIKQKNNDDERKKLEQKRGHMEQYWESNQTREKELEPQYKLEVERDYTNNKLMERLNCELDFRINEKKKSKEICKPYENDDDDDDDLYKQKILHNKSNVPVKSNVPTNFSSKRLIH